MALDTPVAFFVFNRLDHTQRVFAEIARARPSRLLVVADGARVDRPGEDERVDAVRNAISRVDWPCVVDRNYSTVNLGCGRRVASGISWVFSIVEEAIILEDDCLPDPSFFLFCQELLRRYRDDETIAGIGGMAVKGGGQIRDTAITSPSIFIPPGGPLGSVPGRSSIIR